MERKLGEIFTCDGKTYQVAETGKGCTGCAFNYTICHLHRPFLGHCNPIFRADGINL